MRDIEVRRLDKYERMDAFMVDNQADFPKDSVGDKLIKLIRADIVLAKQYAAGQISGVDERAMHIDSKEDDLEYLERIMRKLDRAGDILTDDFPGIENLFGVPPNRSETSMLSAARSEYDLSEQYEARIIADAEVEPTFRADMIAAISRIEAANQSADIAGEQGSGATGGLRAVMSRLAKNSKKLDGVCRNKYEENPVKLAAWDRAEHLERDPKPAAKEGMKDEG